MPYRSPARWLAPLSLVASLVAILLILGGGSEGAGGGSAETTRTPGSRPAGQTTSTSGSRSSPRRRSTYEVQAGDVLSAIAQRTGVSVARLQELNPGIDAQALRVGARLKLRK